MILTRAGALLLLFSTGFVRAEPPVRFNVEVMAVLSKAGCNQGACHGNLNGKGGFKLSLRGEDPTWDYSVLTRDMFARRTDPLRPADSLILRKATASIAHEGGRRFEIGSAEYEILREWIAAGTPPPGQGAKLVDLAVTPEQAIVTEPEQCVSLRATAKFGDGSSRDVTHLAAFDTTNLSVAEINPAGIVSKVQNGETVIAVRFLDRH